MNRKKIMNNEWIRGILIISFIVIFGDYVERIFQNPYLEGLIFFVIILVFIEDLRNYLKEKKQLKKERFFTLEINSIL